MPELPEVETMRRGILPAIGSRIAGVAKLRCARKPIAIAPGSAPFRRRAVGATITDVGRAGKRVVIWLDRREAIVIEPRMTGLVLVVDPPTREHLRWRLELAGGPIGEILYWDRRGLGNVRLFSRKEFDVRFGPERLGPDALSISAAKLQARLGLSRREIKPALLDQRAIAGIGNLYSSEILHAAGIDPRRRCAAIGTVQWKELAAATRRVMRDAIRYEGSTLGDGTCRNALNKQGGYQNKHRVYARTDQPCPRCPGGVIERFVQAQRATFYCARCQK
jgi:formamidopyrimidine-DNA glycosylase